MQIRFALLYVGHHKNGIVNAFLIGLANFNQSPSRKNLRIHAIDDEHHSTYTCDFNDPLIQYPIY